MRPKKTKSKNPRVTNPQFKGFKQIKKLAELTALLRENRDEDTLIQSLQTALEIEFATVPPYLCAWWSIIDKGSSAAESIRKHIAEEEMVHIGLVCNLLVALGVDPNLTSPGAYPEYPTPLPEDIPTREDVALRGFSEPALKVFLDIEYPMDPYTEFANDPSLGEPGLAPGQDGSHTIGNFYTEIKQTFLDLRPHLQENGQLTLEFDSSEGKGVFVVQCIAKEDGENSVEEAIEMIMRQGEGASGTPIDTGVNDLAHYYRFLEIYKGQKIKETEGQFEYDPSEVIPFPEVREMGLIDTNIPDPSDDTIRDTMERFDTQYTEMLLQIEAAWGPEAEGGNGQDYLNAAIETMFALTKDAQWLMEQPNPSDPEGKNYGPRFRLDENATLPDLNASDDIVPEPTWEDDIKYFFTQRDISQMRGWGINLDSYEEVAQKATNILDRVGRDIDDSLVMPPYSDTFPPYSDTHRHWSEGRIKTFQNWINTECPQS